MSDAMSGGADPLIETGRSPHVEGEADDGAPAALDLRSVRFAFDRGPEVLHGVDLRVRHRDVMALLGPSGCGKTTLLRTVAGLVRPCSGTVSIDGRIVAGDGTWVPTERRHIGLVPQEGSLFPHLDVAGNIAFGLRHLPRSQRSTRVGECLELVGLAGSQERRPSELSGGQQQRVALARALAPKPSVVLMDEPFSALDASLRSRLRDDVREALRAASATALLVTHDQEEALSFADRVAVMHDGAIAQVSDPVNLYRHPADLRIASFVGDSVLVPAVFHSERSTCVRTALGDLPVAPGAPLPAHGAMWAVIRPEQIELAEQGATAPDGVPAPGVCATVVSTTYYGHDALVRLRIDGAGGDPGTVEVMARIHHRRLPQIGDRVRIRLRGEVTVFPSEGIPLDPGDEPLA
jgi:iron(III) transport system ATP-binding protein